MNNDLLQTYKNIINKTIKIHTKLVNQLIDMEILNEDGSFGQNTDPSLSQLIHCVSYDNFHPKTIIDMPNDYPIPIKDYTIFTNENISTYFNNIKDLEIGQSLEHFNLQLVKRIQYYCEYLRYQLLQMNVDENIVNKAITLYDFVSLIEKIEILKKTYIQWPRIYKLPNGTTQEVDKDIYIFNENSLDIRVLTTKNDDSVNYGTIKLYEGSTLLGTYDMTKNEIIFTPQTYGNHQYRVEYLSNDQYYQSSLIRTVEVKYANKNGFSSFIYNTYLSDGDLIYWDMPHQDINNAMFIQSFTLNENGDLEKNYVHVVNEYDASVNDAVGKIYLDENGDLIYE